MRYGIVFGILCLAGCAPVGPDFVRPDTPANPAWLEAELDEFGLDEPELANWWQRLDDPVLDSLIETALANNNNLRIAGLRVLESQANLNIATGLQWPQQQVVVGDATAVGASESNANTTAGDLSFTQFNLGASISWEIDFWGKFKRSTEAAQAELLASEYGLRTVQLTLISDVVSNYYQLLEVCNFKQSHEQAPQYLFISTVPFSSVSLHRY